MKLLAKIFRLSPAAPPESFAHSQLMLPETHPSRQAANAARNDTRRELLRIVLRETLNRQGVPAAWLGSDALASTSRSGVQGIHWRLVVRHWDPRLLTHAVALQRKLLNRVMTFDPSAANWLTGISWQFAIPDESVCPQLPPPATWTAQPPKATPASKAPTADSSVEVIAGPVRITDPRGPTPQTEAEVRADLEQLLAARQADFQRHARGDGGTPQSQDARTEPMRLE